MALTEALALRDLRRRFGATVALDGASLVVRTGSVHGLIGQNGAGKSTIVNILAGLLSADAGTVVIGGTLVEAATPRRMERLGVHIIHQEPMLPPGFTVAEALFLGNEPRFGPFVRGRAMHRAAAEAIRSRFDLALRPDAPVDELGAAERQIVQITRSLLADARVVVFDEPTAALVRAEADRLFTIIRRLRGTGTAVIYVSHYLEEVRTLADTVTVLRNGRDVATVNPATTDIAAMTTLMVGRNDGALSAPRSRAPGPVAFAGDRLARDGFFSDISFELRRGEVLGLTGLVGSGAKALLETLFGLARPDRGTIVVDGAPVTIATPADAVRRGIGLVPEDRRRQGVAIAASVAENVTLPGLFRLLRHGIIDRQAECEAADGLIDRLAIRTANRHAPVRALSGGNQQKVALAKWLGAGAAVLLLDEPTVAVDVGAKAEIYRILVGLVADGAAVLLLSTDLAELCHLADRILVMHRGRIVRELVSAEATPDILLAIASGALPPADRGGVTADNRTDAHDR